MQAAAEQPRTRGVLKSLLTSAGHQLLGPYGSMIAAYFVLGFAADLGGILGWRHFQTNFRWILTGTPFYPAQIIVGFSLGWLLGRRLRQPFMVWVWVLPLILLTYALVSPPVLNQFAMNSPPDQPLMTHYFGWICNRCADQAVHQITFTVPFYASVMYSAGALLALRTREDFRPALLTEFSIFLVMSVLVVSGGLIELQQWWVHRRELERLFWAVPRFWMWAANVTQIVVGGMIAAFSISSVIRIRRKMLALNGRAD
ncbi:MAG: hypothetical protein HYX72_14115 [Acidobacteria bacterium]|nr:hypothetical protein [Acidobacteriota bacterium]